MKRWQICVASALVLAVIAWLGITARSQRSSRPRSSSEARAAPRAPSTSSRIELPRWSNPDGTLFDQGAELAKLQARYVKQIVLPNGIEATFFPTRTRIAHGGEAVFQLELVDKQGAPVTGRGDLEAIVAERDGAVYKTGFMEDSTQPGTYRAYVTPRSQAASALQVVTRVSETGLVAAPGSLVPIDVGVEIGGDARLTGEPAGRLVGDRYIVSVGLAAMAPTMAFVRAELGMHDPSGRELALGEAVAQTALVKGDNHIELVFAGVVLPAGTMPDALTMTLRDATLFTGEPTAWSDFWPGEVRVAQAR